MKHKFALFDAPLLYSFHNAGQTESFDLRKIFDNTLVQAEPVNAVTVVANHDTQPGQTVETPVADFFKPLAYALILLRPDGYPCPFYGDLYGLLPGPDTPFDEPAPPACSGKLPDLIKARQLFAYGACEDYFDGDGGDDAVTCVGWVRRGTWDRGEGGCAVVMSNAGPGTRRMFVGDGTEGQVWTDVLGWARDGDKDAEVTIDADGFGEFTCGELSVSVWTRKGAGGDCFPVKFDTEIYKMA